MKKIILISILTLISCSHVKIINQNLETPIVSEIFDTPKTISEAVNGPFRTSSYKERDIHRHPIDTLTFFRIKPTMKILEVTPGSAWYTEILAPFLNDRGQYVMANRPGENSTTNSNHFIEWSKKHPQIAKNIKNTTFDLSIADFELGEDSSMDAVLTFRNVHNWMAVGKEDIAFDAFFKVLKKGGILGIVEHRAPKDLRDPKASTGYVRESDVIKMAQRAGFKYRGRSEVNVNLNDTKDYEKGVWSLPPTFANKEKDREKYILIGESDRMTLKFIKP